MTRRLFFALLVWVALTGRALAQEPSPDLRARADEVVGLLQGRVAPGKRPYHTIIPGMLHERGELLGPFGVMGGFIQAQAHMQLVSALVDDGLDPQAALDRPRFRVENGAVCLEEGLWEELEALEHAGHAIVREPETSGFGGGQVILVRGDALVGGSDPRKDGYAAGY